MKHRLILPLAALLVCLLCSCGAAPSSASGSVLPDEMPQNQPNPMIENQSTPDAEQTGFDPVLPAQEADSVHVYSHSCYDAPFIYRPEKDGAYHFSALTADGFVGDEADYEADAIYWDVYVLDEPLTEDWTSLPSAHQASILSLSGSVDIPLKAGEYVYCLCSLNKNTASPAPENSGVLTITPQSGEFLPNEEHHYQLTVTVNSSTRIDLDGDGKEDELFYGVRAAQEDEEHIWTDAIPTSLKVNGQEFLRTDSPNPMDAFHLWLENPQTTCFYIVDLDASDPYYEIALPDWGYNDWFRTHYFRYNDGSLTYLGETEGVPSDLNTVYFGDGTVSAMTHLNVMQTWSGPMRYRLEKETLQKIDHQFCEPRLPDGWSVTLTQPITVYEKPDLDAKTSVLNPSSHPLVFPSTDGTNWVEIVCADGSRGWAYFTDFSTLKSDDKALDSSLVFGNLFLAG